jgi:predicted membrane chloride channel (bestrophin family)
MHLLADGAAMSGAITAIGLLAAFRLNASYGRYDEGRKFGMRSITPLAILAGMR